MKLTPVQRNAVTCTDNVLLTACPGSGKTRAIIAKLLRCISEVRDTARRVACITYTNAAVHEIEHRMRAFGTNGDEDFCEVSTIHAFCLNNILLPFSWRLKGFKGPLEVLPSDSERYFELVETVRKKHGLPAEAREAFNLLNREPDGTPVVSGHVTKAIALEFWGLLEEKNAIDFPNIVYRSYQLLAENPSLVRGLSCKFPWILVDEFQDTSALQVEILCLIASQNRTKFFLVGDPHQSIYSFAGARPDLMDWFAERIQAVTDFELLDNWRCSSRIVTHAERLCQRNPAMVASGEDADFDYEPTHVHRGSAFQAITEEFLPLLEEHNIELGQAAILAPAWFKLMHLGKQLREYNVAVVGPGARPYKGSRLIAPLAEAICGYLHQGHPSLIPVIERDLFYLVRQVTGRRVYRLFSYEGRYLVCRLTSIGRELREQSESGVAWLRGAAKAFTAELIAENLLPRIHENALIESAAEMEQDMEKNHSDVENITVEELGLFACPEKNLKLLTMHGSKGREFDAVALVDLHEGAIPSRHANGNPEKLAESKRQFYVATTRAKKVLMYITDRERNGSQPSRFLTRYLRVC